MSETLLKSIDAAAQALVTADIGNLRDLGRLYTSFEQIAAAADDVPDIKDAAIASAALLKRMMLDEASPREPMQEIFSRTISTMQQRLRPGVEPLHYPFPAELSSTGSSPSLSSPNRTTYQLPAHIDEDIFNDFLHDQQSVLERLDAHLLNLEKQYSPEQLADVRRIFHTLKGEAAIFELNDINRLCHMTEDLIQNAGSNLPIDRLFVISDWLKTAFEDLKKYRKLPVVTENMISILQQPAETRAPSGGAEINYEDAVIINPATRKMQQSPENVRTLITADIDLLSDFISEAKEHLETIDAKLLSLEQAPSDGDLLNAVFRVFHTIKGAAGFLSLDDIAQLAHTTESLLDLARKGTLTLNDDSIDAVFAAVDEMKKLIRTIADSLARGQTTYLRNPSLDLVMERFRKISGPGSAAIPTAQDEASVKAVPVGLPPHEGHTQTTPNTITDIDDSFSIQKVVLATQEGFTTTATVHKGKIREPIKVDSENLDKLIDAIGELVIIESMIKQDADLKRIASSRLQRTITQMDKITRELQQLGMSLRMIPVKGTFQKMARVVRDLAKKSGKDIEFVTHGEDTMLDKSVVDRIGDPLIHLVRNAVDHGIETNAGERVKKGKPKTGTVELTAFHKGGTIYIEIKDDGRGLCKDVILEKAKTKGLLREGHALSDREIYNFIFLPGFSTAQKVTDVSGRGVGMDVVKRTIEDLRGNIDIDSTEGKGTTFSLRLPLTLAIIDGMMVRIGDERYIIPTLSIVEAVRPQAHEVTTVVNRGEMLHLRDRLIPLFRLSRLFHIPNALEDPSQGIVIVVEDSGKMTGVLVDELLGQQSTVIKSLGAFMSGLVGISGGSIMSDGRVGIIIDVAGIIKLATAQNEAYQTPTTIHEPQGVVQTP